MDMSAHERNRNEDGTSLTIRKDKIERSGKKSSRQDGTSCRHEGLLLTDANMKATAIEHLRSNTCPPVDIRMERKSHPIRLRTVANLPKRTPDRINTVLAHTRHCTSHGAKLLFGSAL
eukprot:GHVO01033304.1.p1 GENE.GHVO01033304.1~~GHVO01033304.1.p1  ORF type:complete len:118 (+),score=11.74 GHVO01033304.1:168-521(+)